MTSLLEFFFPQAYAEIDWTRPYEFLDTELQQLDPKAEIGRRLVDKFERGYSRQDVVDLFRFIDWVMVLPEELASSFKTELRTQEEATRMRYVTSIERLAIQEGIIQNAKENTLEVLEIRFSEVPREIVEVINGIEDESVLRTLHRRAIAISSIAEFQQLLNEVTSPKDSEAT